MASSSTNSSGWEYDVFLNFRGTDTRNNFTSHLHHALCNKGIHTFIDDQLERGKVISPALLETIESSRISILVFSQDYASSTYCLDELVKILECQKSKGQIVLPIFYNVSPEEIEMQTGKCAEAFTRHESIEDLEKVKVWKAVLSAATGFSGWHLSNGNEANLIKRIVEEVRHKLNKKPLHVADYPVGIDYHTKIISHMLSVGSNDVRMVGIYGTGGIGKTTIAKATFNIFAKQFEGSCFLANVRETSKRYSVAQLQETLLFEILGDNEVLSGNYDRGIILLKDRLCSKQVFIVIDDVDDIDQLKKLAGELDWFGSGSRIIITTRDEHLLASHGVQTIYKVQGLCQEDAIQLFSWNAFKRHQPKENYAELSLRVLKYVNGLPLALVVLGSHLYGRGKPEWESCLAKWKRNPNKQIFDVLKISFDALEDNEKAIFLDIACFFKWIDLDYVSKILEACDFEPASGTRVLIEKSLISIELGKLQMHDLIQSMGWQIVHQESPKYPGKRSRLWFHEDVLDVLTADMGTHKIEAVMVDLPKGEEETNLTIEAFSRMKRLRILIIRNAHNFTGDPKSLPNELRWLDWPRCPLQTLPSTFQPRKLVALNMPRSRIKHISAGLQNFRSLKYMDFKYCEFLTEIPDLSTAPNLEKMDFQGCTSLIRIHPSLGFLKKLGTLSFMFCSNLASIPSCFETTSLKLLYLNDCTKLEELPNTMEYMACLEELHLERTALKELPPSIEFLSKLQRLLLRGCKNLTGLPSGVYNLTRLTDLRLDNCSQLSKFPENTVKTTKRPFWCYTFNIQYCNVSDVEFLGSLNSYLLTELDLSGNSFASIPSCIKKFTHLKNIYLCKCSQLREIPELPRSVFKVLASDCKSLKRFSQLTHILQFGNARLVFSSHIHFGFSNCHKLASGQDNNFENLGFDDRSPVKPFTVVLPGREILPWFPYKSEGDSLSFQLPPSDPSRKCKAVLFCIIVAAGSFCGSLEYHFFINGTQINGCVAMAYGNLGNEKLIEFESDHMLFVGLTNEHLNDYRDSKGFFDTLNDFNLSRASVKIQYWGTFVKKCGAYLVFSDGDLGSERDKLVSSDDPNSECNNEPGKMRLGCRLLYPLAIQELEDGRHDSGEAIEDTPRKRIKFTNKNAIELPLNLPRQPTVLKSQDHLSIEELEDTCDDDCQSNGY